MTHADAALTPDHRLRAALAVIEQGWTPAYAPATSNVSAAARKWAERHTVIDGHFGVPHAETHDDKPAIVISLLRNPVGSFAARGVTVHRVISDSGQAEPPRVWWRV